MSDVGTKSVGMLIDELITASLKCYHAQDDIRDVRLTKEVRFDAAMKAQEMNALRNRIIRKIDEVLGQEALSPSSKTYDK